MGYRSYDARHTAPLFPFGFGLSYTSFRLDHLVVSPATVPAGNGCEGDQVKVKVDVSNTGTRDGAEVVEVYVAQPAANVEPPRQLRGFAKLMLKAGETRTVSLTLDPHAFSVYENAGQKWVSPAGTYEIFVGTSSRDLPLRKSVIVAQ